TSGAPSTTTNVVAPVIIAEPVTVVPPPLVVASPAALAAPAPPPVAPPVCNGPAWPSNWVNAWIALESWSQFNGLPKPQQLNSGLEATYQLSTTNGLLMMRMGSHAARFSGMEFLFGFAPKLIRGLPYIHS